MRRLILAAPEVKVILPEISPARPSTAQVSGRCRSRQQKLLMDFNWNVVPIQPGSWPPSAMRRGRGRWNSLGVLTQQGMVYVTLLRTSISQSKIYSFREGVKCLLLTSLAEISWDSWLAQISSFTNQTRSRIDSPMIRTIFTEASK